MAVVPEFRVESSICRIYTWTTEPPCEDVERNSQSFIFQTCRCRFNLDVNSDEYRLFIFCYVGPLQDFCVTVHFGNGSNCISHERNTLKEGKYSYIWGSKISDIPKVIPDFEHQKFFQLKIVLHVPDSLEAKDKFLQTPPYLDDSPCMESLSQDFSKLLNEQEASQQKVELKCGDQVIQAHSSILSSRSEVFSAMFQTDMVEGQSGQMNIQDIDFPLFQEFIHYLYTGKLPELTMDKAKELYEVGDKYAVKSLMRRCASFMKENLTLENFCEYLILADAHSDQDLKESIMAYIFEKKMPVNNEHWLSFYKDHPVLATEVLNRGHHLLCTK